SWQLNCSVSVAARMPPRVDDLEIEWSSRGNGRVVPRRRKAYLGRAAAPGGAKEARRAGHHGGSTAPERASSARQDALVGEWARVGGRALRRRRGARTRGVRGVQARGGAQSA